MSKPVLIENFIAGAVIAPCRIVKPGASDGLAIQAAAAADASFGVSDALGAASGARVDVVTIGVAEVEFGGTVSAGAPVTADASGRAVAAVSGNRIIGINRNDAVVGDIGPILLSQGVH